MQAKGARLHLANGKDAPERDFQDAALDELRANRVRRRPRGRAADHRRRRDGTTEASEAAG